MTQQPRQRTLRRNRPIDTGGLPQWQAHFVLEQAELSARQRIPTRVDGDYTGLDEHDAVGLGRTKIEIVADQHHRPSMGGGVIHGGDELGDVGFVEPGGRLVEGN